MKGKESGHIKIIKYLDDGNVRMAKCPLKIQISFQSTTLNKFE
jgi:hypothetical protein